MSLACTGCLEPLPASALAAAGSVQCGTCDARLVVRVFPALFRPVEQGAADREAVEGMESGCFFHPQRRAVVPCDSCGRFLCSLCDMELGGRHLCPQCVDSGRERGVLRNLETRRVRHDRIALALALYPLLLFYFTLFTAPVAVYFSLRHWNSPGSILGPSRARFVLALLLGVSQILLWGAGIFWLVSRLGSTR